VYLTAVLIRFVRETEIAVQHCHFTFITNISYTLNVIFYMQTVIM